MTAISTEAYKRLRKPQLTTPEKILYGPSRQPLKTTGQFSGNISHKGKATSQRVFVVDGLKTNLLGLPAITALGLAIRTDTVETGSTDFRKRFPSVFQGLGNLGEEFEIHLKPGATPHSLFTPRHVPLPLRPRVKEELDRMEAMGVISKVDQPTPWCAGMVVVPKKEGAIRICVDLKPLNEKSFVRSTHFRKWMKPWHNFQEPQFSVNWMQTVDFGRYHLPRNRSCSPPSSLHLGDTASRRCPLEFQAPQNTSRKE